MRRGGTTNRHTILLIFGFWSILPTASRSRQVSKGNIKMLNLRKEISREPPKGAATRTFNGGEPIMYAFGCALLERDMGDYIIYKAVNLTSGKSKLLSRRKYMLTQSGIEEMADRIRLSGIAGAGRLEAERDKLMVVYYRHKHPGISILTNCFYRIIVLICSFSARH